MATTLESREKELHDFQKGLDKNRQWHRPDQAVVSVDAQGPRGGQDVKPIEGFTSGGALFLDTHGQKQLSQEQLSTLIGQLQAAFQAVS